MLRKFYKHIPRKEYKILGQVHGTGISLNKNEAYKRARFLMGMNAEAIDANVILHTHYSAPTKLGSKVKVTYYGTAIKITNQEYLDKLQEETD